MMAGTYIFRLELDNGFVEFLDDTDPGDRRDFLKGLLKECLLEPGWQATHSNASVESEPARPSVIRVSHNVGETRAGYGARKTDLFCTFAL